jgi:hypothetical protein
VSGLKPKRKKNVGEKNILKINLTKERFSI